MDLEDLPLGSNTSGDFQIEDDAYDSELLVREITNDPVRLYLREMSSVPLLTRDGEIALARCIEVKQKAVIKALSRSPLVVREVLLLSERLQAGTLSICDLIQFSDPLPTENELQREHDSFLENCAEIRRLNCKALATRSGCWLCPKA